MNIRYLYQRLGEDAAYTFKGLHKEADWLEWKYKILLIVPIIFSITSLGFSDAVPTLFIKILSIVSLVFTIMALVDQKKLERIDSYRLLADEMKIIYDLAEEFCHKELESEYESLKNKWIQTRKEMANHPIGIVARIMSKRVIKEEMNLKWLGEKYGA